MSPGPEVWANPLNPGSCQAQTAGSGDIRLIFVYTDPMFRVPTSGIRPFAIACKGYRDNIPAPFETSPGSWIVAECPLCGERRRYLPRRHLPRPAIPRAASQTPRIQDWRLKMGEMRRAIAREEQERAKVMEEQKRMTDRFASTLVIAASIIAAIRLAREQDISRPFPRLTSVISDSVGLARMILERIVR